MNSEVCCQTKPVLPCHPLRLTWLSAKYAARRSASSIQIELEIAQVSEERVRSVHGAAALTYAGTGPHQGRIAASLSRSARLMLVGIIAIEILSPS